LLHAGHSERFRDKELIIKRYINSPSLLYFYLPWDSRIARFRSLYTMNGEHFHLHVYNISLVRTLIRRCILEQ